MSTRPRHSRLDVRVLREDLVLEVAQHEEERDEDRDLEDDRQARRGRVDLVLPVELHQLFVLPLPVVLPALLDLLHLRRVRLEVLHRVDLPHRDGTSRIRTSTTSATIDQAHVRPAVSWNHSRTVGEEVLDRREEAGRRSRVLRSRARGRKSVRSLHVVDAAVAPRVAAQEAPAGERSRRERGRSSRNASSAYCEQLGWYLQVPAGVSRPKRVPPRVDERRCRRASCASPCREPRAPARRATRGPRVSAGSARPARATRT